MEWMDIESAPKDGTWVLIAGGKTSEWDEEAQTRPVVARWGDGACHAYHCEGTNWQVAYWDDDWRTWYEEPTHWMPLPDPPK